MNGLKKILYNCRKATYLIDKRLIGKITFRETVELQIHLAGCGICRIYMDQSQKINEMIRQLLKTGEKPNITLDDHFKETMQERIEDHLNKK